MSERSSISRNPAIRQVRDKPHGLSPVLAPPVERRAAAAPQWRRDRYWLQNWLNRLRGESGRNLTSFIVSMVFHAVTLIILALIIPAAGQGRRGVELVVDTSGEGEQLVSLEQLSTSLDALDLDSAQLPTISTEPAAAGVDVPATFSPLAALEPAAPPQLINDRGSLPVENLLLGSNVPLGGGLEGRTAEGRARLAAQRGGNAASENAVELALAWLAAHQREDGSWSLRFEDPPCHKQCSNPGTMETTTGATGLALLPFLGAGYSHTTGPYREVVRKGLYYLTSRMVESKHGGELHENVTMYAQGLAALALCEAYAMTDDKNLEPPAQKAIDYICYAQHPRGGWRYFAGQPGDTTVTGWQVMALKSARLARLHVPYHVVERVKVFLDGVQDPKGKGAFYGYQTPEKEPGPTAVALLLRMYGGWPRDDERLTRGATYLAGTGPSPHDVYFNYYATQVLHHLNSPQWPRWNTQLRDRLVATQARMGHERGSWFFADRHGSVGGRLYTTAMCAMILEVYYRYMPLYGNEAVGESF